MQNARPGNTCLGSWDPHHGLIAARAQTGHGANLLHFLIFFGSQISGFPGPHITKVPDFQISESPDTQVPRYTSSRYLQTLPPAPASTFVHHREGNLFCLCTTEMGSGWDLRVHWLLKQLITRSGALAAIRARWGNKYGGQVHNGAPHLERSTTMPVSK